MNSSKKAWGNGLFLVVTLVINALGAAGIINGLTQKQVSDMYPTLITPSPATFSIWGVIYTLLLLSVIVMIAKKDTPYFQSALGEITVLFRISCILNVAWIVAFSFVLVELSALFILALVITLSLICLKLLKFHEGRRWLLPLSFGLYAGWLVIATVVNIAAALVKLKWNGFGLTEETWAVIILVIAVLFAAAILLKIKNAAFPLPIAWAYFGIYQFNTAPEGYNGQYGLVQTISLIGAALLVMFALIQFLRNRFALLPAAVGKSTK